MNGAPEHQRYDAGVDAEPDTPLLWVLREQLGLTGTKYGCGIAQCGACTVHVDGVADALVRRCPVRSLDDGQKIVTIEGLSPDGVAPGAEGLGRASTCRSAATASPADHGGRGAARRASRSRPTPTSTRR